MHDENHYMNMGQYFGFIFVFAYIVASTLAQDDSSNSSVVISCPTGPDVSSYDFNLHLISLFVVLATSSSGALIPVIVKRLPQLKTPYAVFFIIKHFGTGIILATAFVHMLPSAFTSLLCVNSLSDYDAWPGVITMNSAVFIFFIEYAAVNYVDNNNTKNDNLITANNNETPDDHSENQNLEVIGGSTLLSSDAQIIGIIILEIGICFHSVIIGMALSVSTGSNFISLWVALVFHQMFEGLGLGSRIAELNYPENSIKPWLMSCAYGLTTPIGIAMGLGVHESYNPASQTALIVQGTLDSLSAGILIYSALVELMANDFIYDPQFRKSPKIKQLGAFICLLFGISFMALIGRWT
ncbi:ZIP zinc/iron transport family [Gigaspora margarita]|uniref:ZIP zinc/iron transport family n=1 Tax=Gigaspora margarita TaxID=4874 RepID=A0A8H4AVJ2_GIGMA|nr:ZIP zinc/iron transport family [Gigaspora margarita]